MEPPLFEAIVDVVFGGVQPPSCSEPSLVKCPPENACASVRTTAEGMCKTITLSQFTCQAWGCFLKTS